MVIGNSEAANAADGSNNSMSHPSGIPQDKIDNIMSGIANTGDVRLNNHRKKLRQRYDRLILHISYKPTFFIFVSLLQIRYY